MPIPKNDPKEISLNHLEGQQIKSVKVRRTENGHYQFTISTPDNSITLTTDDEFIDLTHIHYGRDKNSFVLIDYLLDPQKFEMVITDKRETASGG